MKIRNGYGSCMLVIVLLALIFTTINDEAFAATTGAPTIGTFRNHMNNQKNRFTFETNALGQTVISYNTKTNWDIALAYVNGYTSEYTRLCVTVAFTGTQQFGVEVEVIGKSGYVLRDTETLALNKLAIINADGSYTYDLSIPSSVRSSGISEVHLYIDPTAKVSSTRSMKILDIGFRKDGEPAYSLPASQYTVTVNGSYAAASGAGSYAQGATVSISAGQRSEYTFSGWSTTTSGITFANAGDETTTFVMPARDVTVTANWSQYTLTYNANGGSGTVPAKQTGGIVTVSGQGGMTYSGYTFTGWNTKQDGKGVSYKPRDEIRLTANMTLYAQWAAIPYTVTVNGSYAEESGAGSYTKGTTVSISAGTSLEYTFSGWSTTTSGVTFANAGSETTTFVMPARDVTVTANWSQFTLTYNANGGSGTVPAQTGGIVTVSGQGGMTYSGYTFIGWNTKQDGSDKPYIPGDTIDLTANMTLYAQWATSGNKPAKLFLVGDSTCVVQPNSKLDTDIQGWGYYFKDKVQSNMTVINLASGGATIRSFLDGQDYKLLAKQWSEADYVLLSLGINDAEKLTKQLYKDGLNEFLDLAALRGVIVVFATSQTSQGLRYTYSGRVDDMKEVALSRGIVCLPLNEYTAANMPRSYMTPDNYHPNNLGARYVGDALALLLDESSSSLKYYLNDTTRLDTAHLLNPMPGNSDAAAKVAMDKVRNAPDTLTKTGNGKIYYVSTSGNDNNDGLSPEKAWKTLTKVRSVPAGKAGNINVVLFRRGDIFRGQLYTQNYVSYGAYGVGYKPNIYISERNYNNSSDWVNSGGNVWECQTKIASDVGNIVFNHGENVGIKKDKKTLTGNFDYYYDPSTRKVSMYYNGGNPADKFWDIEFSKLEQIVIISSGNTVTLENLCFKYGGAHGVCGDNNTNITIRGCEFGWIGGGYLEGTSRYGNAIENWGNCDGFLVENCYIYQIYDAALTHQGDTGNVKKVTYRNNLVEYCTYSIEYFYRKNTARMTDILYEGNIMRFSGYGWGEQRSDKGYATHIQSWGHSNTATNFVIRNNILDKARYYLCDINADAGAQYLPSMIGNTYMQNINMNGVAWRNSRQKFGSGIDVWIKANMDATATVVFY